MPYTIQFRNKALTFLDGLDKKFAGQVVRKINAQLSSDPFGSGEKLRNMEFDGIPAFRIRSGNFRVLYTINNDSQVIVHIIDGRKDVYKNR
jgi:mRNA-degrading endonuclease RelE of RelBE toxin-antitoxin system